MQITKARVTEGVGVCHREGGPIEVIRADDSVSFEPGENHRHVDEDEYARQRAAAPVTSPARRP